MRLITHEYSILPLHILCDVHMYTIMIYTYHLVFTHQKFTYTNTFTIFLEYAK